MTTAIRGGRPVRHGAVVAHQAGAPELFSAATDEDIGLQVKSEVGAGEKAIGLVLAVEQRNMRLDPAPHQPADHQAGSIGGVGRQPLRLEAKALLGSLEHRLGRGDFRAPARRCRLDVDDNRLLQIDQIIGAIGKSDLPLPFVGPRRGRIGQRCDFWRGGRVAGRHVVIGIFGLCRLGRCLIKRREVFAHRPGELLGLRPGCELAIDFAAGAGVGLDHSEVDGKAFAADQCCPHAPRHNLFEQATEQRTLAKAAMPVLEKGGVIRDRTFELQATKPLICKIEVRLVAQSPLGSQTIAVADQQHSDHQLGITRGPPRMTVERCSSRRRPLKSRTASIFLSRRSTGTQSSNRNS
ncbi:MAG TPA: hypothetical protein VL985_03390 [Stellaceae bacterium]|nr:hypothetical protein [Stellaceae bacterium]